MSFWDAFRPWPKWALDLPSHIRPARKKADSLEAVRQRFQISHDKFALHIASHLQTTRCVIRATHKLLASQHPELTESELLVQLVASRLMAAQLAGRDLFHLRALISQPLELRARIKQLVATYEDLDTLVEAMVDEDRIAPGWARTTPGFEEAEKLVNEIMERD